ncbi:hypothetical protein K470DRAFT_261416 [Piedraia hortae CBS 480.64]|uniref:Amino acid permease/ SLC12A domain-containing protein n=1 Tax=Piedraia hortae CBS 480.64 TaxID=1314780 RepID=A0A6A7CDY6_9PEZI|nr:hypothetical protein K470DRAFT_261416 [Piedraia hortae CBS 480.64]
MAEFLSATIKCVLIMCFIVFSICITAGVGAGVGAKGRVGFHSWKDSGAFGYHSGRYLNNLNAADGIVYACDALGVAAFSYQGIEMVAIAIGEAHDYPRRTIPWAINKIFYRTLVIVILNIFLLGLVVPYDTLSLGRDPPYVVAVQLTGVPVLPSMVNAVLLCVTLWVANSILYSGSRVLVGIASRKNSPK